MGNIYIPITSFSIQDFNTTNVQQSSDMGYFFHHSNDNDDNDNDDNDDD